MREGKRANDVVERYLELLKESKVRGYLFQQQNHTQGFEEGVVRKTSS